MKPLIPGDRHHLGVLPQDDIRLLHALHEPAGEAQGPDAEEGAGGTLQECQQTEASGE